MKKTIKMLLTVMVACMLLTMLSIPTASAAGTTNISLTVDKTEVNVGDTVTVVISNQDLTAEGFGLFLTFDSDLLECTKISGAYDDEWMGVVIINSRGKEADADASYADTVELTNSDGIFSFAYVPANDTQILEGTVAKITFTAKAAGSVTFTLEEQTSGTSDYKGVAETKTLTIKSTHTCSGTLTAGQASTCENAGWKDYYTCSCGKFYADADCTTEIPDLDAWKTGDGKISAESHSYTYDCDKSCKVCGEETRSDAKHAYEYVCSKNCKYCGEETRSDAEHNYTTGTSAYTCICGAKFTGWDGDCYIQDAVMLKGWKEIEGAWYYLDTVTGKKASGLTRVPYNTELGHGANAEDVAYAESKGETFVNKTNALYLFDENGKLLRTTGIVDDKYYADGIQVWHPGFVTVENELYYFVGDAVNGGNKAADGIVYVTRGTGTNTYKAGYIKFADGQVDTEFTEIVTIKDVKYYFENGVCACGKGLVKIGEQYIYVRSAGQLAIGKYYITKDNGLEGFTAGMKLYFDENGKMLPVKDGIVEENGVYYYYKNNRLQCGAGLIEYKGDIYYVRSSGKVATGTYYITNTNGMEGFSKGDKLVFGEDGKMLPVNDGIVEENGVYYYYKNNRLQCGAGVVELTDDQGETYYIYVRSNGQLATGEYYPTTLNGYLESGKYDWGEDGKYYPVK